MVEVRGAGYSSCDHDCTTHFITSHDVRRVAPSPSSAPHRLEEERVFLERSGAKGIFLVIIEAWSKWCLVRRKKEVAGI